MQRTRIAVDIGGTFTDLALEQAGRRHARWTAKVLTTPARAGAGRPGRRAAIVLGSAGIASRRHRPGIHGTTLATNAIIERKGARTALLTTEGFRDVLALGNESRYDQYDLNITLPEPLVPRRWRLPVPERLDNTGRVLLPLDEDAVRAAGARSCGAEGVESLAIGFLHAFVNPAHERRAREPSCASCGRSCRSRSPPRSRRRCANGSASPPPPPTPMCSR